MLVEYIEYHDVLSVSDVFISIITAIKTKIEILQDWQAI